MDERITQRLLETSEALSLFSAIAPSEIEEVFTFKASHMDTMAFKILSRYTIMLGQYLITLQVKFNTARVIASQKRKVLDRKTHAAIQAGVTEGKTLKEREASAISIDPELRALELDYDEASAERDLLDGIDRPIIELINAIKSELRRRAEERQYTEREGNS